MSAAVMPAWLRLADALTVVLLAVAAWIAVTGGGRYLWLGVVIPLRSAALFVFVAGGLQGVRHVLAPRPSALARLRALDAAIAARPALAAALRPFLATRLMVFAVGFFAVVAIGFPPQAQNGFRISNHPVIDLPARYDAGWYGTIAVYGYSWGGDFGRQQDIAFFPALPLLARALGSVFGAYGATLPREARMARMLWAATLIALAAFFGGLYYVVRLGEALIGRERAADAAMLLAAYPFAVFYSAPYTEALFLLAAAGSCVHFLRREWWAASAWGILAGLTRPNGFLLAAPLAILAWQQWRAAGGTVQPRARAILAPWAVAAMPGIGMLLYTAYLYQLTGIWFAWAKSHGAWGRSFQGLAPFASAWDQLSQQPLIEVIGGNPAGSLNTIGLLFACALVWPTFRRLGVAWGVFVVLTLAGPLLAGGVLSLGRLTSTLFPLFLALAAVLPRQAVPACAAAFALLQGLAAVLFFTWRDLY
ncbi:MAG TPA: mannosyltransferase family protein [Burkholderiales bacterium]|nr:mannosyltransferase family protein [Burkholderiales bacterium]